MSKESQTQLNYNHAQSIVSDQIPQKSYAKTVQYIFPTKLLNYPIISGRQEFRRLLKQQQQPQKPAKGWVVKIVNGTDKDFLYAACTLCKAKINYKQNDDGTWRLFKYNNKHVHQIHNKRARKLLKDLAAFNQANKSSKARINPTNISELFKKRRILLKSSNFSIIKQLISHLSYDFRYQYCNGDELKNGFPETLVAVSQNQKNNYNNYGQSLNYDISYNCVKQQSFVGSQYGIGIFYGFDNNNRKLIFGFSLTTTQTSSHMQKIFQWFFDIMKKQDFTTAIITKHRKNIIIGLNSLKQKRKLKFHHIYDFRFYMKYFHQQLKQKKKSRKAFIMKLLSKLMKQSDPILGRHYYQQFKLVLLQQQLIFLYENFNKKVNNLCVWSMPNQFIGLCYSNNQELSDLLKLKTQHQISLYEFVQKFQNLSKQRINKSLNTFNFQSFLFQNLYDDDNLQQIRFKFEKEIFNVFISYYQKSGYFQIVSSQMIEQSNSIQFIVKHIVDDDIYAVKDMLCTCNLYIKIGISCQHIIHVNKQTNFKNGYMHLINKRWLAVEQKIEEVVNMDNEKEGIRTRRSKKQIS